MKFITTGLIALSLTFASAVQAKDLSFNAKAQESAQNILDNWFEDSYQVACSADVGHVNASTCEVVDTVTGFVVFSMGCHEYNGKALCGINTTAPDETIRGDRYGH